MDKGETTSIRAYHIIKRQNNYNIYNSKLVLEGAYTSYAVALKKVESLNKQRYTIILHSANGTIEEIFLPNKEKRLSLAENGKATPTTKRKKTIVLDEC